MAPISAFGRFTRPPFLKYARWSRILVRFCSNPPNSSFHRRFRLRSPGDDDRNQNHGGFLKQIAFGASKSRPRWRKFRARCVLGHAEDSAPSPVSRRTFGRTTVCEHSWDRSQSPSKTSRCKVQGHSFCSICTACSPRGACFCNSTEEYTNNCRPEVVYVGLPGSSVESGNNICSSDRERREWKPQQSLATPISGLKFEAKCTDFHNEMVIMRKDANKCRGLDKFSIRGDDMNSTALSYLLIRCCFRLVSNILANFQALKKKSSSQLELKYFHLANESSKWKICILLCKIFDFLGCSYHIDPSIH